MELFYESGYTLGSGLRYSAAGNADVRAVDAWFQQVVYVQGLPGIVRQAECLLTIVRQLVSRGELPGYEFLNQMPDDDQYEWVQKACTTARRLHRENPNDFPACGVKDSFDMVRRWRKAKPKAAKSKKE